MFISQVQINKFAKHVLSFDACHNEQPDNALTVPKTHLTHEHSLTLTVINYCIYATVGRWHCTDLGYQSHPGCHAYQCLAR